jgi:ABC-type polysaccharide/polyol phosphate transport system ATPase subunit
MTDVIIHIENLGKMYRIRTGGQAQRPRYTALRDVLAQKLAAPFRMLRRAKSEEGRVDMSKKTEERSVVSPSPRGEGRGEGELPSVLPIPPALPSPLSPLPRSEDFWALKEVSFEVKRGEVLGIIGRNGAGKSTLLKILSRITEPTEGCVRIRGRVASLLEVGTGFHPELTGRENIFLNGAILGMTRAEIKRKFDEIVAFAEVEKFLDTPVKRYSSGMYVRLAFAVAAHLEPEILIVDEVLAVGDAEFQKKCLGKMKDVSKSGRTVLFVSHNMGAVQTLCSKAVYLQAGSVKSIGEVDSLVSQYLGEAQPSESHRLAGPIHVGTGLDLLRFEFLPNPVNSGEPVRFALEFRPAQSTRITELALLFYSAQGTRVAILDLRRCGLPLLLQGGQVWQSEGEIKSFPFVEGDYSLGLYANAADFNGNLLDLVTLAVGARNSKNGHTPYPAMHRGIVELDFTAGFLPATPA